MDQESEDSRYWAEHYEHRKSPEMWLHTATTLKVGADILWERHIAAHEMPSKNDSDFPLFVPASLLYAFAMENVLKGALTAKGFPIDGNRDSSGFTHSQLSLADELARRSEAFAFWRDGTPRAIQVESMFARLSRIATWAGRYPFPKKVGELAEPELPVFDECERGMFTNVFGTACRVICSPHI